MGIVQCMKSSRFAEFMDSSFFDVPGMAFRILSIYTHIVRESDAERPSERPE